ncbi:uncharacterized protein LOC113848547 isoform X2 [Abrus precatorius]|uniref:Uncharacterized protein LOC113848547 isoform X2 n=1 Tax=Abrus precatorius TaxID=3816 RepID=A0A8B8JQZ2_ABRPR|nr:uncharacterized protein LOC113848547 isoform X2 [Abrus precatorius]
MQRLRNSILGCVSAANLKRKSLKSWLAIQDTYFSTKDTFERHRVVFTVGTSIASVATAFFGYSLRHLHESRVDQRLQSIENAVLVSLSYSPPPLSLSFLLLSYYMLCSVSADEKPFQSRAFRNQRHCRFRRLQCSGLCCHCWNHPNYRDGKVEDGILLRSSERSR